MEKKYYKNVFDNLRFWPFFGYLPRLFTLAIAVGSRCYVF